MKCLRIAFAAALLSCLARAQGPLAPASAPAPVFKTVEQAEPRIPVSGTSLPVTLNRPGAYYLTGNLTATSAASAIVIATNGVTLDLMGFTVCGKAAAANGISASGSSLSGVEIRNGIICEWGQSGIHLPQAQNGVLRDLIVRGNGADGAVAGSNTLVETCTFLHNGGRGLAVGDGSLVRRVMSLRNQTGIDASNQVHLVECNAYSNTVKGIVCADGALITTCIADNNASDGISVRNNSLVTRNLCKRNGQTASGSGLYASSNNVIDENHLLYNYRAFNIAGVSNILTRNTSVVNSPGTDYINQPTNWVAPEGINAPWGNIQ